jgi:hypothetical protein
MYTSYAVYLLHYVLLEKVKLPLAKGSLIEWVSANPSVIN